jgi:hypothetical protein
MVIPKMIYINMSFLLEVVLKPSIGLEAKTDCNGQPQEYREYFEDWTSQPNTEIEPERGL